MAEAAGLSLAWRPGWADEPFDPEAASTCPATAAVTSEPCSPGSDP